MPVPLRWYQLRRPVEIKNSGVLVCSFGAGCPLKTNSLTKGQYSKANIRRGQEVLRLYSTKGRENCSKIFDYNISRLYKFFIEILYRYPNSAYIVTDSRTVRQSISFMFLYA